MVPKDLNTFLTFVCVDETTNYFVRPNSCKNKSVNELSIAKSYKHSAKMIFAIQ